ncbi:unnamed protein product [Heligmosomoides polygyrus]|uniref:Reverse transcriptase domain-containing protein n=1 Tax=Heligmosomoides polygyrus TaxID=6339 RepID=A0A183FWI2_HELPZ|nr:unnamed protein product [Heligmosomoides polygyrus]
MDQFVTSSSFPAIGVASWPRREKMKKGELEREVQAWCDRLEQFGLKLNVKKTEYLATDVPESSSIKVNDIEPPR